MKLKLHFLGVLLCGLSLWAASPPAETPRANRARRIAEAKDRIEAECRSAAGGDWQKWIDNLEPFRQELRDRIAPLKPYSPQATANFESRSPVLESITDPPLFEADPGGYLQHVLEAPRLPQWLEQRSFIEAMVGISRWLSQKGVELIVVPVPKLTEIYPDVMAKSAPADKIIAPHVRRMILELLRQDVEVVDLLPMFLEARKNTSDLLYSPVDPHWTQKAQIIAVQDLGTRLRRHRFVRDAKAKAPIYSERDQPLHWKGVFYEALNPQQRARVESVLTMPRIEVTPRIAGGFIKQDAPVIVIGDSYVGGIPPLLARELNMPVQDLSAAGQTTQAIKDFFRDPSSLASAKAVILIASLRTICIGNWPVPPPISQLAKTIPAK